MNTKKHNLYETFGKHLTIDAYQCNKIILEDMSALYNVLDELPQRIGMSKVGFPMLVKCPPTGKKDCGGISGFVIIAESHISLHTFPDKRFLTMDVYSCNSFEEKAVLGYLKTAFKYKDSEIHVIPRGMKFPRENI